MSMNIRSRPLTIRIACLPRARRSLDADAILRCALPLHCTGGMQVLPVECPCKYTSATKDTVSSSVIQKAPKAAAPENLCHHDHR